MATKGNIALFLGRLNPMTTYHMDLILSMEGQKVIATTQSFGRTDPIPQLEKLEMTVRAIANSDPTAIIVMVPNVIDALTICGATARERGISNHIKFYCGDDRAAEYIRLNSYTDLTGVVIEEVVSVARIHPDHSATKLRELARLDKWDEFSKLCGYSDADDVAYAFKTIQDQWKHTK